MASKIRIFRSTGATAPGSLEYGELAVTIEQGTAGTSANKAGRLFIGNASGNPVEIGGEYTYKLLDHTPGQLINSSAVIIDGSGQIDGFNVAGILTATRTDITDLVASNLNITGVSTFAGGFNLNGNVTIGDSHLDTLTVNSRTGFNTDLTLNQKLLVVGIATYQDDVSLEARLSVAEDAVFNTGILVTGITTTSGIIDANGGMDVSGGTGLVVSANGINVTGVSTFANAVDMNGGLDVSGGETILSSATVSDLTQTRVVLAGVSGALTDDANLTFSSNILDVNGIVDAGTAVRSPVGVITALTATDLNVISDARVGGALTVTGDLTVNGTLTSINSTTVTVDDKNIELASTASPSDATADGGGITLKGTSDYTIQWMDDTDAWEFNQHVAPDADNVRDLGLAGQEWRNLFVDGLAELDDVNVSAAATIATVDINGGAIDGTVIGAASSAAATFTTVNYTSLTGGNIIATGSRIDAGDVTFTNLRVTGVSTVASLFLSTGTNTNGVAYFDANGQVTSTATPSAGIQTSNFILTTNASGVPSWTDTIDGGTF